MHDEESRIRAAAEEDASAEDSKRQSAWANAKQSEQKGQYNKLMHLVEQSKVFASIMQQRMQQEEEKRQKKTEAERKKLEKQEEKAEELAGKEMRGNAGRATRGAQKAEAEDKKELPVRGRGRGRPKKGEKKDGSISSWLKKEDIEGKAGGMSVSEAVAEAAGEYEGTEEEEGKSKLGAQNLRSADQPAAVTGGIMRGYQLEGLYWLRSLYENGLNGILGESKCS